MTVSSECLTSIKYVHELQRGDVVQSGLYNYHEKKPSEFCYLFDVVTYLTLNDHVFPFLYKTSENIL